ncbi:hypothetical protein BJF78_17180 [Pseudonocardia sp. CNS-139]|nr:hypothetical protein BJF78_17180 [Pseudonocardia sp. CNS-139]
MRDGAVWAMSDGGRRVDLLRLDPDDCSVTDRRTADVDPYDAEDLALGPDGAFWVADTGDNERRRTTIAVVVVPSRGEPRLHRLTYPDGPHDAEALLVDTQGRPVVVTKDIARGRLPHRRTAGGRGPDPARPDRRGDVPAVDHGGRAGRRHRQPGGHGRRDERRRRGRRPAQLHRRLALPGARRDLVAALQQPPVQVPLPGEPQGEAVAFEADGTLLSGSETRGGEPGRLRAVPGAAALAPGGTPATTTAPEPLPPAAAPDTTPDTAPPTAPEWLPAAIGGGVVVGLLLLVAAAIGLRGALRRR